VRPHCEANGAVTYLRRVRRGQPRGMRGRGTLRSRLLGHVPFARLMQALNLTYFDGLGDLGDLGDCEASVV
jgi:hypothetical protein